MSSLEQATRCLSKKSSSIPHDVVNSQGKRVIFTSSNDRVYLIPECSELDCQNVWWTTFELEKFRYEASVDIELLIERHNLDYGVITSSGCMLSLLFIMKSQLDSDAQEFANIPATSVITEFSVFGESYDVSEHMISEFDHMNQLSTFPDDLDAISVI